MIQRFGVMKRTDSPSTVRMSVTNVADMMRLPITDWLSPLSTSTAYTTARLVVESASPPISDWSRFQPINQWHVTSATTNGAPNETTPIAALARHSRRSCGRSTSAPARNVSTTPAKEPMKVSQSGTVTVKTFPMITPPASSRSAADSATSTETMLAIRITTASTDARARSLTAHLQDVVLP